MVQVWPQTILVNRECEEFEYVTGKTTFFFLLDVKDKMGKGKNGWESSWMLWTLEHIAYWHISGICPFLPERFKKKKEKERNIDESGEQWINENLMRFSHQEVFICLQIKFLCLHFWDQNILKIQWSIF